MKATLIERFVFGTVSLYPSKNCPLAQQMADIQRRTTFAQSDVRKWEALGFEFDIHKLPE